MSTRTPTRFVGYNDYRIYRNTIFPRRGTAGEDCQTFPSIELTVLMDWHRRYMSEQEEK